MNLLGQLLSSYQVEVSGWDASDKFFVENTTLAWSEPDVKKAYVRRPLRPGLVLFLRLLEHEPSESTFPVAYRIESVGPPDTRGRWEVTLVQLRPRKADTNCENKQTSSEAGHDSHRNLTD